jgi:EmrB/QacA subfamily drug resistance transporter
MPTDPDNAAQTAVQIALPAAGQADQDSGVGSTPADAPHSLAALRLRFGPNHRWWVLLTVMIGNMAALMAATTINVAVPAISRQFQLGQQDAQWLATSFMAAMTISMLATPWLLQRFGYRRCYVAMLGLLGTGGLVGGLSPNLELLLAMRMVEGLAGGVLQTIPGVIMMHAFAKHEQGRAMGVFGFGTVLAPALGPSVGGLLVDWFGWRAIFFFVLPFCVLAALLARRCLPHVAPGGMAVDPQARPPDAWSLLMLTGLLAALLNGLVTLQRGQALWGGAQLALAAMLVLAFVARQRRVATPLMQLSLYGHPVFRRAALVAVIYGAGLFGSTYLLPVFMLLALGMSASTVGAVLLPAGLALACTIPLAGRLADRAPLYRTLTIGLLVMTASFGMMVFVGSGTAVVWLTAVAVLGRIGLGCVIPSLSLSAMRVLDLPRIAAGASTMNFLRQLGGAVGVNLVGILLASRLHTHAALGPAGTLRAFHEVFVLLALLTGAAALAAWQMKPPALPPASPA